MRKISSMPALAWFLVLVPFYLLGCNTPTAKEETNPVSKPAAEKSGNQLWSENCMRCHNVRPPDSYSATEWEVSMRHMRVRANLTAEEDRKILEFLKASSK